MTGPRGADSPRGRVAGPRGADSPRGRGNAVCRFDGRCWCGGCRGRQHRLRDRQRGSDGLPAMHLWPRTHAPCGTHGAPASIRESPELRGSYAIVRESVREEPTLGEVARSRAPSAVGVVRDRTRGADSRRSRVTPGFGSYASRLVRDSPRMACWQTRGSTPLRGNRPTC